MTLPPPPPPTRSLRYAAYLAIVYGIFGTISGAAGAATFIPFKYASTFASGTAAALTVVAIAGAAVCVASAVAGWGLLRGRSWGWNATAGTAVASVASVAALVAVWPASWGFLLFVSVAYAVEGALLLVGRGEIDWRSPRASPG